MSRPIDVLVVGAGPAGIAAHVTATRAESRCRGRRRRDVPARQDLRRRTDRRRAAIARAARPSPRGARRRDMYERVDEAVLVSPSGRRVSLPMPPHGEHAGVVTRDCSSTRRSSSSPVRARRRRTGGRRGRALAPGRARRAGHDCRGRRVTSRDFVVAADGHFSSIRTAWQPAAGPALGEWHAARQYFSGVPDRRLWVAFEQDLLPGYAWVFPLPGDRANVGFGVLRDGRKGHELKALWADLLDRPVLRDILGPDAVAEDRVRAWPIPTRYDPASLADGRVLFAGDAAAVVDPMTGEGIAQAIETGMLAADAIADRGPPTRRRSATATARVRRARSAPICGSPPRSSGCSRRPLAARAAIRAVDTNDWTRRNFARWMFEDYPRAALVHAAALAPTFTAKGAYASDVPS